MFLEYCFFHGWLLATWNSPLERTLVSLIRFFFIANCTHGKNILNSFSVCSALFFAIISRKRFLEYSVSKMNAFLDLGIYLLWWCIGKKEIVVHSLHHFPAFLIDFKEYNVLPSGHMWGPVKTDKSCGTNVADCDPTSNFPCCSARGKCVWTCSGSTSVDFRFPYSKFTIKLNFQKLRHVYLFTCMVFYFFPVSFESLLYWYVSKWYYQKSKRVLNEREWKHLVLIDTHFT